MMVEIDTLFQTETAKKNIPFSAVDTYVAYKRDYPPHPPNRAKNALQIVSLAAYASETNNVWKMHANVRLKDRHDKLLDGSGFSIG